MNGYLVLLRHGMDDLPIGLFDTQGRADQFASTVEPMPTEAIRSLYGTDCSTPCCVEIVEFANGLPVNIRFVRDFDTEEEEPCE